MKTALADKSEHVRAAAARVAPRDYVFDLAAEKHPLVLAHIAIKTINEAALAPLLVAHGKNALIREAALTGLRGKEAAFAKTLAQTPSDGSKAVIGALAELIALAGKAGPIADMLDLAANSPENRDTILKGLAKTDSQSKTIHLAGPAPSPPKRKPPPSPQKHTFRAVNASRPQLLAPQHPPPSWLRPVQVVPPDLGLPRLAPVGTGQPPGVRRGGLQPGPALRPGWPAGGRGGPGSPDPLALTGRHGGPAAKSVTT